MPVNSKQESTSSGSHMQLPSGDTIASNLSIGLPVSKSKKEFLGEVYTTYYASEDSSLVSSHNQPILITDGLSTASQRLPMTWRVRRHTWCSKLFMPNMMCAVWKKCWRSVLSGSTRHVMFSPSIVFLDPYAFPFDSSLPTLHFVITLLSYSSYFTLTHLHWLMALLCNI